MIIFQKILFIFVVIRKNETHMNLKNNHVVIMAGGIGSRFWPMSSPKLPKQFIDVLGCGHTLIQLTVDRFKEICPIENIWISTLSEYAQYVEEQLPDFPKKHILLEPCRRSTAPCIAYACWKIKAENPKANVVVTPCDHIVMDVPEFQRVVNSALKFTEKSDAIVTLGMKATRPETGYGYIEADLSMACPSNQEIYRVYAFKEKPDQATAERYLRRKNYFWNAGIFVWNVSTIVNALRVYQPPLGKLFERMLPYFNTDKEQEMVNELFPMCENISVDYAIMENVDEIYVFPASFGWSDLGTWGSLYENLLKDPQGNVCVGENIKMYESRNCVVHTTQEKKVVVQGLDGYIVAEKDNTLLVCRLGEEQRIKEFSQD